MSTLHLIIPLRLCPCFYNPTNNTNLKFYGMFMLNKYNKTTLQTEQVFLGINTANKCLIFISHDDKCSR